MKKETLTPLVSTPGGGVAIHRDGDHACVTGFEPVATSTAAGNSQVNLQGTFTASADL